MVIWVQENLSVLTCVNKKAIFKVPKPVAKECLLSGQEQACTRITRLFGCLFVIRLFSCHHAENGPTHRKMAVDCPLVITSIVETHFQTRQDHERGIIGQASLLHSRHWVLFLLYYSLDCLQVVFKNVFLNIVRQPCPLLKFQTKIQILRFAYRY